MSSNSRNVSSQRGSRILQYFKTALLVIAFTTSTICLHIGQYLGIPLRWFSEEQYYQWQIRVKKVAASMIIGLNDWRTKTTTCFVSGDGSMEGQIRQLDNGQIAYDFVDRMVLISNHVMYTDWIFMWWSAYIADRHGEFYVVLKDSLRRLPFIGPGMAFFQFIFLARHWETDRDSIRTGIDNILGRDRSRPLWLLLFPEGTNLSRNARKSSSKWAAKNGIEDFEFTLLPRSRGLQLCLEKLRDNIEWVYDSTLAYENIPTGEYGQDTHSLKAIYVDGRAPPRTHIHWRRFEVKDIPFNDSEAFDKWLFDRWAEKDELLRYFAEHSRFPAVGKYVETNVNIRNSFELLPLFFGISAVTALAYTTIHRVLSV